MAYVMHHGVIKERKQKSTVYALSMHLQTTAPLAVDAPTLYISMLYVASRGCAASVNARVTRKGHGYIAVHPLLSFLAASRGCTAMVNWQNTIFKYRWQNAKSNGLPEESSYR